MLPYIAVVYKRQKVLKTIANDAGFLFLCTYCISQLLTCYIKLYMKFSTRIRLPITIVLFSLFLGLPFKMKAGGVGMIPQSYDRFDFSIVVNGRKYDYLTPQIEGHQFLYHQHFTEGTAIINGKLYKDLLLNLDIFNQQLVLEFYNSQGAKHRLSMSDASVTSFSIGTKCFEYKALPDGSKSIYQVIGNGRVRTLYSWKKRVELNTSKREYYYTPAIRTQFVEMDGHLKRFRGNRSFLSCFSSESKILVRHFIKANRIKVSRASDEEMALLINYCNSISYK